MRYPLHIQNYYQNLKHGGSFASDISQVQSVRVGSVFAGEVIELSVKLDESQTIIDARFKVYGCGYSIATCAYLCENLIGKNIEAIKLTAADFILALQLPLQKYHCALLAENAIRELTSSFAQMP